ncbi:MAG: hypothetical protein ACXWW6_00370 [Candidatus Limnocylindrales bacterium]
MPYQREAVVVLAAWREAERVLMTAEVDNHVYQDARAESVLSQSTDPMVRPAAPSA